VKGLKPKYDRNDRRARVEGALIGIGGLSYLELEEFLAAEGGRQPYLHTNLQSLTVNWRYFRKIRPLLRMQEPERQLCSCCYLSNMDHCPSPFNPPPACRFCILPDHTSIPVEETVPRIQQIIKSKVLGYLRQEIIKHYTYSQEPASEDNTRYLVYQLRLLLPAPEDLDMLAVAMIGETTATYMLILLATCAKPLSFSASKLARSRACFLSSLLFSVTSSWVGGNLSLSRSTFRASSKL